MEKKMNKLSAIEKLRIRKTRLKAKEQESLHAINTNINYLQQNLGSLSLNTTWNVVKAQLPPFVQNLFPEDNNQKAEIEASQKVGGGFAQKYPHISSTIDQLIDIVPAVFKGFKPIIIAFALRKIKKMLV